MQYRPYLYLGDAVGAIFHSMETDLFSGKIFNVLSENYRVKDVINAIEEVLCSRLDIKYTETPLLNQHSYTVSCDRFVSTGYVFRGEIRSGISETVRKLSCLSPLGHTDHSLR